jgi:hypothetical protein
VAIFFFSYGLICRLVVFFAVNCRSRMNVMSQALCGADCWLRHREGRFGNWPTSVFGSSSRGESC